MPAVPSTNLRKGQAIKVRGELGLILELEHRTPGNLNGFVQVIMRSFSSGKSKDFRFQASEKVEVIEVDRQKLEFSYSDSSGFHFMNPESYETVTLPDHLVADLKGLLIENMAVDVLFVEGNPMSIDMPASVDIKVTEAADGVRGDSANNVQKPVTLSTGKIIQAPLFIKTGETIRVDTRTGKYLGRA
ncbi:MAG: elongation factor P [Verrucomicrobiales bacterium]